MTALSNERIMPKIGTAIGLSPVLEWLHVFDGETGNRLAFG
jgi:hypothetical protein